jgi:transposase
MAASRWSAIRGLVAGWQLATALEAGWARRRGAVTVVTPDARAVAALARTNRRATSERSQARGMVDQRLQPRIQRARLDICDPTFIAALRYGRRVGTPHQVRW